jgi:LPXTG-motif cell wall-anchored protein
VAGATGTLPRTGGIDPGLVVLAGAATLAAGALLRRRYL